MDVRGWWVLTTLAVGCMAACGVEAFTCQSDAQCGAGLCQPDGYCSFPADDCPSGQRYGQHSGSMAGECVMAPATGSGDSSGEPADSSSGPLLTTGAESSSSSGSTGSVGTTGWGDSSSGEQTTGPPLDPDLVLWLEFEQEPGRAIPDSSSIMAEGSCVDESCPESARGRFGQGAQFDGNDDYVLVPHGPWFETYQGFTVSAWVWLPSTPLGHDAIVGKPVGSSIRNSWELYFYPNGSGNPSALRFGMFSGGGMSVALEPGPFPARQWIHVAGTWDGESITLWVDGEVADTEPSVSLDMDDHPIHVGADDDNLPTLVGEFSGVIDDVRVYQRALVAEEIAALARR